MVTGKHARPKSKRRKIVTRSLLAVTSALVLVAAGTFGYAWYLNGKIQRLHVGHLSAAPQEGVERGTENILLVGSTDRCALKNNHNASYGLCSQGVTGINSDVIMIAHLNYGTHKASLLSIPRDLFLPNARKEGAFKIDAALYEGPSQLVAAIRQGLGISIQHYVELNFDTFASVVDALGGIHMNFPEPVFDGNSGLNISAPGCVQMNGVEALQLVRARHLQYRPPTDASSDPYSWPYDPQSDLSRIRRNHEFLTVLASSVQKRGLTNLATDEQLVSSVAPNLKVDSSFSASHMLSLVLAFHAANPTSSPQLTMPVVEDLNGTYRYNGANEGDVVWPDIVEDRAVIRQFLGLKAGTNTLDGVRLPKPQSIAVALSNGTGKGTVAAQAATALNALGFRASVTSDTPPVGTESETVVYYANDTNTDLGAAQAVADQMTGNVILAYNPSKVVPGSAVTVVVGTDFGVQPPPAPTTSAKTTPSLLAGTTRSTPKPSAAVDAPKPWDPTACPDIASEK